MNNVERYTWDELTMTEGKVCAEFNRVCPVDAVILATGFFPVDPKQDFFDRAQNGIKYEDNSGYELIVKNGLSYEAEGTRSVSASELYWDCSRGDCYYSALSAMAKTIGWNVEANRLEMTIKYQEEDHTKPANPLLGDSHQNETNNKGELFGDHHNQQS
jgi:hypothetical protein